MATVDRGSSAMVGSGWRCCLASVASTDDGENTSEATTTTRRISLPLQTLPLDTSWVPHTAGGANGSQSNSKDSVVLSALSLEEAIECCLHFPDDEEVSSANDDSASSDHEDHEPVKFLPSEDSHLLKCRRPKQRGVDGGNVGATILGIEENKSLYNNHIMGTTEVEVTVHRPAMPSNIQDGVVNVGCCCNHPMGNWDRVRDGTNVTSTTRTVSDTPCNQSPSYHPRLRIVDLTQLQLQRRASNSGSSAIKPILNGPGNVCHLLRSVLSCPGSSSHCASPWEGRYVDLSERQQQHHQEKQLPCRRRDEVIAILLLGHHETAVHVSSSGGDIGGEDNSKWNRIERPELSDIVKFRTGDAASSYYLYSMSQLNMPLATDNSGDYSSVDLSVLLGSSVDNKTNRADTMAVTMLVYRHLPPRDILSLTHPTEGTIVENSHDPYYLWEAHQPPLVKPEELSDPMLTKVHEDEPPPMQYRLVAPPYQSHRDLYPGLFNEIMKPESIRAIAKEALNIPQWTAWPEKNHYSSADDEDDEDGAEDRKNSPYPATWTVFPLCHTFPANVLDNRKWIGKTCSFVPQTKAFLEGLGPALRTALFSRLEPRTTLSAHTGWADLANHVLRIHIPLVVPEGEQDLGLCGTWVDGCVETHRMGEIVSFDDSKVHRAFNYTNEERIVLIVDLARTDALPSGTATGGHTDQLDKFIKELT